MRARTASQQSPPRSCSPAAAKMLPTLRCRRGRAHQRAMGVFCGMNLTEHPGPKGQIITKSRIDPFWFSSVRDTVAFTMLPEQPRDIRAIYVSDMGRAPSWDHPGATNWIDARKAFFVIGSRKRGGMGAAEAVPFGDRAAADAFVAENGGRVVAFAEIARLRARQRRARRSPGPGAPGIHLD